MKNPKHTPGPWKLQYLDEIIDSRGIKLCHVSSSLYKTGPVAGVFNESDYRDERNANAALIAAAPDMLEALERLRAVAALVPDDIWAKASDEYNAKFGPNNDYKFTMDLSREAINKAKGGE